MSKWLEKADELMTEAHETIQRLKKDEDLIQNLIAQGQLDSAWAVLSTKAQLASAMLKRHELSLYENPTLFGPKGTHIHAVEPPEEAG